MLEKFGSRKLRQLVSVLAVATPLAGDPSVAGPASPGKQDSIEEVCLPPAPPAPYASQPGTEQWHGGARTPQMDEEVLRNPYPRPHSGTELDSFKNPEQCIPKPTSDAGGSPDVILTASAKKRNGEADRLRRQMERDNPGIYAIPEELDSSRIEPPDITIPPPELPEPDFRVPKTRSVDA